MKQERASIQAAKTNKSTYSNRLDSIKVSSSSKSANKNNDLTSKSLNEKQLEVVNTTSPKIFFSRLSVVVFAIFFLLYIFTMPRFNVGYGDSDMLLAVAYNFGLAHPPGYPLYMLLLGIVTHLPLPFSIATKGHLLSAILSSASLSIVFQTCLRLYSKPKKSDFVFINQTYDQVILSLVATFSLGFSTLFWLYGHIAEKYSLLIFLITLLMYVLVNLNNSTKRNSKSWIIVSLLFGLAMQSHYTAVYLLPVIIWLGYEKKLHQSTQTIVKLTLVAIGAFLMPYLIALPLSHYLNASPSWAIAPGIQGFLDLIRRVDFRGQVYGQNNQEVFGLLTSFDANQSLLGIVAYVQSTLTYFVWWPLIPLFFALRFSQKRFGKNTYLVIGFSMLLGPALAGTFLKWPADLGSQAILQRQYLLGYPAFTLLLFLGLIEVVRRFGKAFTILFNPSKAPFILGTLFVMILSLQAYFGFQNANLASYDHIHALYSDTLKYLEPNSIATCYSDVSCFALLYLQFAEGMRPDVTLVPLAYPLVSSQQRQNDLVHLAYTSNPYRMLDIISHASYQDHTIYAIDLNNYYYNFLGLQHGFLYYVPEHNFGQIRRQIPESLPSLSTQISDNVVSLPIPSQDLMRRWQLLDFTQQHVLNGITYLQMGQRDLARNQFNRAANINYRFGPKQQAQINAIRNNEEHAQAKAEFKPGTKTQPASYFLDFIPGLLENNQNAQALLAAKAASIVEPDNITARSYLAWMYEKMGDETFAKLEYENILKLDPQNATASSKLKIYNIETH